MAKKKTASTKKRAAKTARPRVKIVQAEIVEPHDKTFIEEARETDLLPENLDLKELAPEPVKKIASKIKSGEALGSSRTPVAADPIQAYLREVRKYPLLSREQELALAKKYYETKDPLAAQALVTANLRFVIKVAAEYSKFGARLIDLVQEGNMGLMHAVRDYNPYKGVRLITYAVWWIRGYIQEYLMKQYSLVKIGTTHNQKKLFYRLQKEKEALDAIGENQNLILLGTKLGIPTDEVQEMAKRLQGRDVSLNQPLDVESKSQMIDLQKSGAINPDEMIEKNEELEQLTDALKLLEPNLNEREKIILRERILADEPLTLQEIGEKYKITREAVRQVEARLIEKIRKTIVNPKTND